MRLSAGWFITTRPDGSQMQPTRRPARLPHMIEAAGNGNSRSHLTWLAKSGRVREEGQRGAGPTLSDLVGIRSRRPPRVRLVSWVYDANENWPHPPAVQPRVLFFVIRLSYHSHRDSV